MKNQEKINKLNTKYINNFFITFIKICGEGHRTQDHEAFEGLKENTEKLSKSTEGEDVNN